MAYKFISITPRADGGRDVIYDEDDVRRLACQIYKTKDYPQRFTWAELDVALANQLFSSLDKLPPPPDPRTPEEIAADAIATIKAQLVALDREVPRIVEDLVGAVKKLDPVFVIDPSKQAIIDAKAALRTKLATLTEAVIKET
jgi:hypothetical protein